MKCHWLRARTSSGAGEPPQYMWRSLIVKDRPETVDPIPGEASGNAHPRRPATEERPKRQERVRGTAIAAWEACGFRTAALQEQIDST